MLKRFFDPLKIEAGCDEAGRGCLAGPVYAAAVILHKSFFHPLLNDSKQLSEKERNILRPVIEKEAIAWCVSSLDNDVIDKINILNASIRAMHDAVKKLSVKPQLLLIDGNRFLKYSGIPHKCFVKGDATYSSIAAASVLAKTYRDEFMMEAHNRFPDYNWYRNKGYGTLQHRTCIRLHGYTPLHRKTFHLKENQPEFSFSSDEK